jgi:hypothetical protein
MTTGFGGALALPPPQAVSKVPNNTDAKDTAVHPNGHNFSSAVNFELLRFLLVLVTTSPLAGTSLYARDAVCDVSKYALDDDVRGHYLDLRARHNAICRL